MKRLRRYWKRIFIGFLIGIGVVVIGFLIWASTPAGQTMPIALQALDSTDSVSVTSDKWLVFEPLNDVPTTGFIFYPGGRVLVESYAPYGQAIADAGYMAIFVPMPLNLAVLNVDEASRIIGAYPEIEHWAIGGHSLGGAMATRYAYNHPDTIDGLALLGAFPEAQFDFSGQDTIVASIYGELDGLATVSEVENSFDLLPDDAILTLIEGGNHAQFGWYGEQAGDNRATITHEQQFQKTIESLLLLLEAISQ